MIYPTPSDIPDTIRTTTSSCCFCLQRWYLKFSRWWAIMHLSYRGGKYSVERLLALDEYTRKHSLLHAILVCVGSLLPAECFIITQESVPLQDPALGWRENYGFWVRAALVIGAVLYTIIVQAKYLLRGFVISNLQLVCLLICVMSVQMIVAVCFAANVWFPIPFTVITLVPAFYVVSIGSICLVVGMPVVREVLRHHEQLLRFGSFVASQQLMAVMYPAYQVLFHAVTGTDYQLPVIILLPVIKLIVKNIALRCLAHMEDMMPEAVIFTVDFFNALYMATSMESAKSTSTVAIIVLIDIAQSATVLFRLYRRTATVLMRLKTTIGASEGSGSLLGLMSHLCKCSDQFEKQSRQRIRIRSCIEHNISPEIRELLHRLERIPHNGSFHVRRRYTDTHKQIGFNKVEIFEERSKLTNGTTWVERRDQSGVSSEKNWNSSIDIPKPTQVEIFEERSKLTKGTTWVERRDQSGVFSEKNWNSSIDIPKPTQHTGILLEVLEVFFTTECLLLSAFLDACVPFFYGIFMFVMVHLQSAKYHSELVGVTKETIGDVVDSIFVFSVVELVALVLLAALIYRNLGMNAVYHLAFVLETQTEFIQSKLLGWVTMTLAFRVVHFGKSSFLVVHHGMTDTIDMLPLGVDFTFQFEWLSH
ncbi:hypothetical protein PHMEG_0004509 [Phytophthora megakarya]|uniref:Transmembrane protein n=1 Tax=Phytophthora megakarya TaxID=4795 RepID=A0A225WTQ5_9STRA|nr:hypothetical protein PHMEG_0004509 [Phytophthora megakarya]